MKYLIVVLIQCLFLTSCQISVKFKGHTSYRREIEPYIDKMVSDEPFSCSMEYSKNNRLTIINGLMLKECIQSEDAVLVYLWSPLCRSSKCLDLNTLQNICDKNNTTLYIVAEYYDLKKMYKKYRISKPIIGIDTKYYKTNFTSKYLKYFFTDLIENKEKVNVKNTRYVYFKSGQHVENFNQLDESTLLFEN